MRWLTMLLAGCSPSAADSAAAGETGDDNPPADTAGADTAGADTAPGDTALEDTDVPEDVPGSDSAWDPDAPLELCINEFMPDNSSALALEDGSTPDWIELHNPGAEAVDLAGWTISDDRKQPDEHQLDSSLRIEAGAFLLLYADNPKKSSDPKHLSFSLSDKGGDVGLYAPDGRGQLIGYGTVGEDFSVARTTDCCTDAGCLDFAFRGTPGTSNEPEVYVATELVSQGELWSWWDLGSSPGDGWTDAGFDDSGWQSGPGPLGFGDPHIVTTVDGGSESDRTLTLWFRRSFVAPAVPAGAELVIDLLVDDGAVVYLNGVEINRDNLAKGDVDPTTLAESSVSDADEAAYTSTTVDATALLEGDNVLAVEVHQASSTSTDLGFDLALSLIALK